MEELMAKLAQRRQQMRPEDRPDADDERNTVIRKNACQNPSPPSDSSSASDDSDGSDDFSDDDSAPAAPAQVMMSVCDDAIRRFIKPHDSDYSDGDDGPSYKYKSPKPNYSSGSNDDSDNEAGMSFMFKSPNMEYNEYSYDSNNGGTAYQKSFNYQYQYQTNYSIEKPQVSTQYNYSQSPSKSSNVESNRSSYSNSSSGRYIATYRKNEYVSDLIEQARKDDGNSFVTIWTHSGDNNNRFAVLNKESNDIWVSADIEQPNIIFQFKGRHVKITHISISCDSRWPLDYAGVYGYNGSNWEYIATIKTQVFHTANNSDSYIFDIDEDCHSIKYNAIAIEHFNGQFSIIKIKLYGEMVKDNITAPDSDMRTIEFKPTTIPRMIDAPLIDSQNMPDIFEKAKRMYGPELRNFVNLWTTQAEGYDRKSIFRLDKYFYVADGHYSLTFYFPDHSIQLEKIVIYYARPPHPTRWIMLGYRNNDNKYQIILDEHHYNVEEGRNNIFEVAEEYKTQKYKCFKFICLNGEFGVDKIDFHGKALLDQRKFDESILSSVSIPERYERTQRQRYAPSSSSSYYSSSKPSSPAKPAPIKVEIKPKSGATFKNTYVFDGKKIKPKSGATLGNSFDWDGKTIKPCVGATFATTLVWDGKSLKAKSGATFKDTYVYENNTWKPKSGATFSNSFVISKNEIKPKSGATFKNTYLWTGTGEVNPVIFFFVATYLH